MERRYLSSRAIDAAPMLSTQFHPKDRSFYTIRDCTLSCRSEAARYRSSYLVILAWKLLANSLLQPDTTMRHPPPLVYIRHGQTPREPYLSVAGLWRQKYCLGVFMPATLTGPSVYFRSFLFSASDVTHCIAGMSTIFSLSWPQSSFPHQWPPVILILYPSPHLLSAVQDIMQQPSSFRLSALMYDSAATSH